MTIEHTAEFVDLTEYLAKPTNNRLPDRCIVRESADIWQVRKAPARFNVNDPPQTLDWAIVKLGDLVRIPLIPYRSSSTEPHEFLLGMLDMMTRVILEQPTITRIHWVIGKPVEDLNPESNSLRAWVGLAVKVN